MSLREVVRQKLVYLRQKFELIMHKEIRKTKLQNTWFDLLNIVKLGLNELVISINHGAKNPPIFWNYYNIMFASVEAELPREAKQVMIFVFLDRFHICSSHLRGKWALKISMALH